MPELDDRRTGMTPCSEEQALLRTLKLALDEAFDVVLIHKPDGTLVYFNRHAAEVHGLSHDEFAALPPFGWTSAPSDVIAARMNELERAHELRFVSEGVRGDGSALISEVHSRWLDTDEGPLIVSVTRDITEKAQAEALLKELAFRDPLTGLANRTLLEDRMGVAIANAERHGDLLGIVFIDIDDFKPVNDTYGHDAGDQVLRVLAGRLEHGVRQQDTVARLGGDEFVVVLPRLDSVSDLRRTAEKLSAAIRQPIDIDGMTIHITPSIGFAMFDRATDDQQKVIMRADIAMYQGRKVGVKVADAEEFCILS
jgi:diguanylate cyclase (GGDEF)-like protein/PAS domain S-box-containing protein